MAWMNQEKKAKLAPAIKKVLAKYGFKGTIGVRTHTTLVVNIKSGKLDLIKNYNETVSGLYGDGRTRKAEDSLYVNPYWYHEHFTGKAKDFFKELFTAMNDGNHDRSDIQSDYFDVGWYVDVNVGKWDKPYEVIG